MSKDMTAATRFPASLTGMIRTTHIYNEAYEGMSLRDWFAGQALAGMHLPVYNTEGDYVYENMELIAKAAYWMADAMIAERDK